MPSSYAARKVADIHRMVQRSASLMLRVQTRLLPRARQRLNSSDDLLNQSTGHELASAQRILDTPDDRTPAPAGRG